MKQPNKEEAFPFWFFCLLGGGTGRPPSPQTPPPPRSCAQRSTLQLATRYKFCAPADGFWASWFCIFAGVLFVSVLEAPEGSQKRKNHQPIKHVCIFPQKLAPRSAPPARKKEGMPACRALLAFLGSSYGEYARSVLSGLMALFELTR